MSQLLPEHYNLSKPIIIYQPHKRGNGQLFKLWHLGQDELTRLRQQVRKLVISAAVDPKRSSIPAGQHVAQILLIDVYLLGQELDQDLLTSLDSRLGPHAVFRLIREGRKDQFQIHYKEALKGGKADGLWRIRESFSCQNLTSLPLEGQDLDAVYESWVRTIGQEKIQLVGTDLGASLELSKRYQRLEKEVAQLKKKVFATKSPKLKSQVKADYLKKKSELDQLRARFPQGHSLP